MGNKLHEYEALAVDTAYTTPNDLLASDITVPKVLTVKLNISVSAPAVLRLKAGGNQLPMNGGVALVANQFYPFEVLAVPGIPINFSLDTSVTVRYAIAAGIDA